MSGNSVLQKSLLINHTGVGGGLLMQCDRGHCEKGKRGHRYTRRLSHEGEGRNQGDVPKYLRTPRLQANHQELGGNRQDTTPADTLTSALASRTVRGSIPVV